MEPFMTIYDYFASVTVRKPNSPAVYDANTKREVTFNDLQLKVESLYRYLKSSFCGANGEILPKLREDFVVALCMEPSEELIISLFAILKLNAAYVPLDVTYPLSRVIHILEDCHPVLLLSNGRPGVIKQLEKEKENPVRIIHLEDIKSTEPCEEKSPSELSKDFKMKGVQDIALILYTSGSTGVPKGVRIPVSAVMNRLEWQWKQFPFEEDEVCCFKTSLTFVDSISEIFGPILTGHKLVVIPKSMTRQVDTLVDILTETKVRRLVLVPTLLTSILLHRSKALGTTSLPDLKLWICSGEVLSVDLLESFFDVFPQEKIICNFYGSTEVMGDVSFFEFSSINSVRKFIVDRKVPIGNPIPNCEIYLLDDDLQEVTNGKVGEIFVTGKNLAKGYVGDSSPGNFIETLLSSLNESKLLYRTGDFGRKINGLLYYEGRKDSQIKIRGHRIDINEVNVALQNVDGVDNCYILCYLSGTVDQQLFGFYCTQEGLCTPHYVVAQLRMTLPMFMLPQVIKMDSLPLLLNGKVDKQTLAKSIEIRLKGKQMTLFDLDLTDCPDGLQEEANILLKSTIKTLGASAPSRLCLSDNFFYIGGNSLNCIRVITSLQDVGYEIGVGDFLRAESFMDILKLIKKNPDTLIQEVTPKDQTSLSDAKRIHEGYRYIPLQKSYKDEAVKLLANSFATKAIMGLHILEYEEYYILMEALWDICQEELSFLVTKKEEDKIVGVYLSTDHYSQKEIKTSNEALIYFLAMLEDSSAKAKQQLPGLEEGELSAVNSWAVATAEDVSSKESVSLVIAMEMELIRRAKQHDYQAIIAVNTSSITRHICDDVLGYEELSSLQLNQWIAADGTRPFHNDLDDSIAALSILRIANSTNVHKL